MEVSYGTPLLIPLRASPDPEMDDSSDDNTRETRVDLALLPLDRGLPRIIPAADPSDLIEMENSYSSPMDTLLPKTNPDQEDSNEENTQQLLTPTERNAAVAGPSKMGNGGTKPNGFVTKTTPC